MKIHHRDTETTEKKRPYTELFSVNSVSLG